MKIVLIDFPPGLRNYADFDPLHSAENPLFGVDVGVHQDGRTRIQYMGARDDLEEYVPLEITITGISPVNQEDNITVIQDYDGKGQWFVAMDAGTPINVACTYNGDDAEWQTPCKHPYGHRAFFFTKSVAGVITINATADVPGMWEISQWMINEGMPSDSQLIFKGLLLKTNAPQV